MRFLPLPTYKATGKIKLSLIVQLAMSVDPLRETFSKAKVATNLSSNLTSIFKSFCS